MNIKSVGIIPARYNSTRFPAKLLALIHGTTLLQRTYEKAAQATLLKEIIVATDDERIFNHVLSFGGKAVMTPKDCQNGTERVAIAAKSMPDVDIVVNIQGDEPLIDPKAIDLSVQALIDHPDRVAATLACPLMPDEWEASSVVKCVFSKSGQALYFSRSLIPGSKGEKKGPYYKHIGLYAYRADFLPTYLSLPETPLMLAEDLEQLKILEHGFSLHVTSVESPSLGVDVPDDIKKVEQYLCQ
ncbi:MAG: 3-deoxy-manno-octulosonate cytidylyltransferase [Chlamydiia bacterium]|nr:3-deoxy-manno-octulosonate cytidylyltransferase [Chlamydiia bacterium]